MRDRRDIVSRVTQTIEERKLGTADSPTLLMVSGGSDSTALSYICTELLDEGRIGPLGMLHVNHQLRGEASDTDQAFVEDLAEVLDIPLFVCEIDIKQEVRRSGENEEAVARRERYLAANEALESLCRHNALPLSDGRIFTAHTQDDRVENFYMRSIVGTGPGGFRSMLYANGPIMRPLLDVSREELRAGIRARAEAGELVVRDGEEKLWREDATNAHTDKFRAYVRHEIVPLAKKRNPQLLDTLCRVMNLIGDEDDMLDDQAASLEKSLVTWNEDQDSDAPLYSGGCTLIPEFGEIDEPLQRRVCMRVLQKMLGADARVETASIQAILKGFEDKKPLSGYTNNIQGDLAVSANKYGVRIEPMSAYRARRKKNK